MEAPKSTKVTSFESEKKKPSRNLTCLVKGASLLERLASRRMLGSEIAETPCINQMVFLEYRSNSSVEFAQASEMLRTHVADYGRWLRYSTKAISNHARSSHPAPEVESIPTAILTPALDDWESNLEMLDDGTIYAAVVQGAAGSAVQKLLIRTTHGGDGQRHIPPDSQWVFRGVRRHDAKLRI